MGGEKDTIPPTLISSFPASETLKFNGTEIQLTFDERVQATQIKRKLLITPFSDVKYDVKASKNVLELSFEEPFDDSTTYTINFADAVTDVTESNPVLNLSLAFSTGDFIDSLFIFGKVLSLMTNLPAEEAGVSLYPADDTLDVFTGKPYYFAFADEKGAFRINNMKSGKYRVYAFLDENRNFLNESAEEPHGFVADTFELSSFSDSLTINLFRQDIQAIQLVSKRAQGSHFDVRYNKIIETYSASPLDSLQSKLHSNMNADSLVLRLYNSNVSIKDSIAYLIHATDKVGNISSDTVYVKFTDRAISFDALKLKVTPPNKAKILDEVELQFNFSKPIARLNIDSLLVKYDSLRTDKLDSIAVLAWNFNRTQVRTSFSVDREYLHNLELQEKERIDSLKSALDSLTLQDLDDSIIERLQKENLREKNKTIRTNGISLYCSKAAFISIENDSSDLIDYFYSFKTSEEFGKISGTIQTTASSFFIQLLDSKYQIIDEVQNTNQYLFEFVPPGKYKIRVLVDSDSDGKWSSGNVQKWTPPEPVYFFPDFIELRENWEINEINLSIDNVVDKP